MAWAIQSHKKPYKDYRNGWSLWFCWLLAVCLAAQLDKGTESRDVLVLALILLASADFTNYLPSSGQIKVDGGKCFSSQSSVLPHHHHTTATLTTTSIIPTVNTPPTSPPPPHHHHPAQHRVFDAQLSTIQGGTCTPVSIISILEVVFCVFTQTLTIRDDILTFLFRIEYVRIGIWQKKNA